LSLTPTDFLVKASIALLDDPGSGTRAWKLAALPLNVKTLRQLGAARNLPRLRLSSQIFATFGVDSLSLWYRRGLSLAFVGSVSRSEVHLISTTYWRAAAANLEIRRGTRPIGALSITPSRGSLRSAINDGGEAVAYIASWARG
jgi:hypothetical protein